MWHEPHQVTLVAGTLAHIALGLGSNPGLKFYILTELIPDCFRLQKLVSDKAVFNKDIRGKELCWLDRALPC